MKLNLIRYLYLIILLQYIIVSYFVGMGQPRFNRGQVEAGVQSGVKTEVKAEIAGKFSLRLFGYTSADSLVQVLGVRTYAQGTSDRTGYFLFKDITIALEAKEICISAIDTERRSSFPLCIALPNTVPDKVGAGKPTEIGPLLLSPTLSLSSANIWQNQQAGLSGMTIPESEVTVSFFEVSANTQNSAADAEVGHDFFAHLPASASLFSLVPKAFAAEVPILTAKADRKGRYSVNLPSSKSQTYRVFAKAVYKDSLTPKSQTLTYDIGAVTDYFVRFILPYLVLYLVIITLLIILIYYAWTNKRVRAYLKRWYRRFIEKRLTPFAVRRYLQLKRLLYNFRQYLS